MADENDTPAGGEVETFTRQQLNEAVAKAIEGLERKNDELLNETKAERTKRQALEKAQEEAEAERARQTGEFKTLYEKTQSELEKERTEKREFMQKIQAKEVEGAASALASELTRDTARASLLRKEAQSFAKYTDEGVKFEIGGVVVDRAKVVEHLRGAYPFLVDGNQSNGGGASGGSGGAASKKLSDMSEAERIELASADPDAFKRMKSAQPT